jgi:D-sedoheptulose 7-phosphate isomerase
MAMVNDAKKIFQKHVEVHVSAVRDSFEGEGTEVLEKVAELLIGAFKTGHKVLICGNGGSAADAQHVAAEFIGRFKRERKSLPAIALTTDTSILTAVGNDYSYEQVFSRQIEGLGQAGDVLIAISTSGTSKNILEAAKMAKRQKMTVIGFSGRSGGLLKNASDIMFCAISDSTPQIQEVHITALHAISEAVEAGLFQT